MPCTPEERTRLVELVASGEVAPDCIEDVSWEDGTRISREEIREVIFLACYEIRYHRGVRRRPAQRRAMRLLKSYLSPEQLRQLKDQGCFIAIGSGGGVFRLYPHCGAIGEVEKHGRRFFQRRSWCFHDPDHKMPPADETIGHLFHLLADEPGFREQANSRDSDLWDGEWTRWLNITRRCRETGEELPYHPRFNATLVAHTDMTADLFEEEAA